MAEVKRYRISEPYLILDCDMGEAPFFEEDINTLRFLDIHKQHVHTVNLTKGPSSHRLLAEPDIAFSTTADLEGTDEVVAFGGKHGYGLFNRIDGSYKYIKRVWQPHEVDKGYEHRLRGNDGAVDSRGRYWLGMMNDPRTDPDPKPEGVLFRLDSDGTLHRMLENVKIPNGMSWSADDKVMYFTDSPKKCIEAFDFDAESGSISNPQTVYQYEGEGVPDGHCQDENGNLWVAICEGGKVLQVSPTGKLLAQITLPTTMPTCPVFCGTSLFITSGQEQDPDNHPESAAVSGSLFSIDVGVRGQKPHRFKWNPSR